MASFSNRFAGARPDEDSIEHGRLRARLAARLVDEEAVPMRLGRYVLGDPVGAGAMGTVYSAFDEELDRTIAIKILRVEDDPSGQPLREARAVARLSHPNVIEVYDVGVHKGRVFIAMELVHGQTLAEWATSVPSWSERLDAVVAAARGLAAAHRAGLVHRDVKPTNILVGDDGRVRLMDFGLARVRSEGPGSTPAGSSPDESSGATAPAGTPGFIAPEVMAGAALDARADQFSLAVTATRVLADAPRRIEDVLRRGMHPEPTRRWPSVTAMADALMRCRRPSRARPVVRIGAVLGLAGVAGITALAWVDARAEADCARRGWSIAEVYGAAHRDRIARAVQDSGMPDATAATQRLLEKMDAQAQQWRAAAEHTCRAELSGQWSAGLAARASGCLADVRGELGALADLLREPDAEAIHRAILVTSTLDAAEDCTDERHLAHLPPPPPSEKRRTVDALRGQLFEADALGRFGRWKEADAELERLWPELVAANWPPMLRSARIRRAEAWSHLGEIDRARSEARTAYYESVAAADWRNAATAAVELSLYVGQHLADPRKGLTWNDHAKVAIERGGDPSGLIEGSRLTYRAAILDDAGRLDESFEAMQRAVEVTAEAVGPRHPQVAALRGMLASWLRRRGELERARAEGEAALADLERTLGPNHAEAVVVLNSLAGVYASLGDLQQARDTLARAVEIRDTVLPDDTPESVVNLAILESQLGNNERAEELLVRALADFEAKFGPDHPRIADTLLNLGTVQIKLKRHDDAMATLQRCLRIREETAGPDHPDVAWPLMVLVDLATAMNEHERAPVLAARATTILERAHGKDHPDVAEGLLVWGANRLDAGELDEARPLLQRARKIFAAHLPPDHPRLAQVDGFIAELDEPPPAP